MRTLLALVAVAGVSAAGLPPLLQQDDAPCQPNLRKLKAPGCDSVASDTAALGNPIPLWGRIECETPNRHRLVPQNGDPRRTGLGRSQDNDNYRRIRVRDGDDYYGERCELGRNNHRPSRSTFAIAREGDRRVIFFSIRLPERFPIKGNAWQSVLQLKQTQPAANGGGSPMVGIHAADRQFSLHAQGHKLWSIRARRNRWVRFALSVRFSQDPERGRVRVFVDRNRDGDARDRRERSPRFRLQTLKRETTGGTRDGITPGESIPAHLRVGIYHDSSYSCPPPAGCVVHFDNIQVLSLED